MKLSPSYMNGRENYPLTLESRKFSFLILTFSSKKMVQRKSPFAKGLLAENYIWTLTSNHHLEHKLSVLRTLFHRAQKVIKEWQGLKTRIKKLNKLKNNSVFQDRNSYKPWMFRFLLAQPKRQLQKRKASPHLGSHKRPPSYSQELSKKQGVGTYQKPSSIIWFSPEILYPQKGKTDWFAQSIARVALLLRFTLQRQQNLLESGNILGSQERQRRSVLILAREDDMFNKRVREAMEIYYRVRTSKLVHRLRVPFDLPGNVVKLFTWFTKFKCPGRLFPNILPSMSTYVRVIGLKRGK